MDNKDLSIVYLPVQHLIPYTNNARTHSKKQIEQIKRSIETFGFTNPILIDGENGIIAGHGRIEAAKLLGLTQVPCIELNGLNKAQKRAYIIADNKIAENAGWDKDLLRIEFGYLTEYDINFDISITGFETAEIDLFLQDSQEEAPNPLINIPKIPTSKIGDIWQLGKHRLICGSALESQTYDALMEGKKAHLVFTDPPYNVPVAGHICGKGSVQHPEFAMASGEMTSDHFKDFLSGTFLNLIANSVDGSIHFICMDWRHISELLNAGQSYTELKNLCVWNKTNGGMGSLYRSKHELIFVYKNGQAPHINNIELGKNGRYRTNVWDYAGVNTFSKTRNEDLSLHPTVKPIQMVVDALLDCSKRNQIVLDCFGGSGTTMLAAEKTGRICYTIELDPIYVDVIIRRYEEMTGKKALHLESGLSYLELSKLRSNLDNKRAA